MFGERGILMVSSRSASVVAKLHLHLAVLERKDFIQILEDAEICTHLIR
jgi:CRP-like cAMP-binding protein